MKTKRKKYIVMLITILVIATLLLGGLTYAYYKTRVIGNESTNPSVSVISKSLEIVYGDGTGRIFSNGVVPGYTETKTFTVENTGDDTVKYAVYLEDVINELTRTEDLKYQVTCSPNCNGTDGQVKYPKLSGKIVENEIASGITHNYEITINYINLPNENQSDDMGAEISGKFQIYSPNDIVDIEGVVADAEDGDYVQINSVEKKSQIVDGKYRLPGVEIGKHSLKVISKEGTIKGSTSLTIEKGTAGINESTVTISDLSETVTINIMSITEDLGINIKEIKQGDIVELFGNETLVSAILNNNEIKEPLTTPGIEASLENEAVLAVTEDDDGPSYYFRGNVENNYVNFSNMCWRIVRIQGDGGIKLVLADENGECDADTYSKDNTKSAFINSGEVLDYSNYSNKLESWSTREGYIIDTTKLFNTSSWCDDLSEYNRDSEWGTVEYGAYVRLFKNTPSTPTLKCDMEGAEKFSANFSILNADEVAFAGTGKSGYLNINAEATYWNLSPAGCFGAKSIFTVMVVDKDGQLSMQETYSYMPGEYFTFKNFVRPAIILKSDVRILNGGIGTIDAPYVVD